MDRGLRKVKQEYERQAKEKIALGHETGDIPSIQETRPEAPIGLGEEESRLRSFASGSALSPSGMAFVDDTLSILSRNKAMMEQAKQRQRKKRGGG